MRHAQRIASIPMNDFRVCKLTFLLQAFLCFASSVSVLRINFSTQNEQHSKISRISKLSINLVLAFVLSARTKGFREQELRYGNDSRRKPYTYRKERKKEAGRVAWRNANTSNNEPGLAEVWEIRLPALQAPFSCITSTFPSLSLFACS